MGATGRGPRSTPAGAVLGAFMLIATAWVAVWTSGHLEVFSQNRGLLQLLVAIPAASLLTGSAAAAARLLRPRQMLWAALLVLALIVLGTGVLGPGVRAWPWALALGLAVPVPWLAGVPIGSAMRSIARRRSAAGS